MGKESLTWEDVKLIVNIADKLLDGETQNLIDIYPTEQEYYEKVLKIYNSRNAPEM